jgi:hypothetical protein
MRGTWQTTSGDGSGGGLVVAVIVALVLIGSSALTAIVHALEAVVIVLGCTVFLGIAAGIGVLIWRTRSDHPRAAIAVRAVSQLPPISRPQLEEPTNQPSTQAASTTCTSTACQPTSWPPPSAESITKSNRDRRHHHRRDRRSSAGPRPPRPRTRTTVTGGPVAGTG